MTAAEKKTIEKWESTSAATMDRTLSLAERLMLKRKKKDDITPRKGTLQSENNSSASDNVNTDSIFDHVIGSAAEVERLWSIARYILTDQRSKLAPILLEAILFLRFHRNLWDELTVMEARDAVRTTEKQNREETLMDRLAQKIAGVEEEQRKIDEENEQQLLDHEDENDETWGDEALLQKKERRTKRAKKN